MNAKIPSTAPRNPCVAPSLFRRAGSHRPSGKALRQRERSALRQALKTALNTEPPDRPCP